MGCGISSDSGCRECSRKRNVYSRCDAAGEPKTPFKESIVTGVRSANQKSIVAIVRCSIQRKHLTRTGNVIHSQRPSLTLDAPLMSPSTVHAPRKLIRPLDSPSARQ